MRLNGDGVSPGVGWHWNLTKRAGLLWSEEQSCLLQYWDLWQAPLVIKKSNSWRMSRTLKASVLLAGAVLGLAACSDSGTAPDASGDVGTMTNGTVSGATTGTTGTTGAPGTSGTTTMGGAVTSAAVTGSTTTSSVGAGGMSTSGIGGSTSGATTGGVAGAGMGGATMGGMGGATMGGMGGTGMAARLP